LIYTSNHQHTAINNISLKAVAKRFDSIAESFGTVPSPVNMTQNTRSNGHSQTFMSPMTTFIVDDELESDLNSSSTNMMQQFMSPMISFSSYANDNTENRNQSMNQDLKQNRLDSIRKHLPSLFVSTNMIGMWSDEKKYDIEDDMSTNMLHHGVSSENLLNQTMVVTPTESVHDCEYIDLSLEDFSDDNLIRKTSSILEKNIIDGEIFLVSEVKKSDEPRLRPNQNLIDEIGNTSTVTNPILATKPSSNKQKRKVRHKRNAWKISARSLFFGFFTLSLVAFVAMTLYCYISIENLEQNWQEQQQELLEKIQDGLFENDDLNGIIPLNKPSSVFNIANSVSLHQPKKEKRLRGNTMPQEDHNISSASKLFLPIIDSSHHDEISIERSPIVSIVRHGHNIPNNIIFTHKIDLINTVFPFENKSDSLLKSDEKELLALQNNVKHIIQLHPSANVQFLTNDDCILSIQRVMTKLYNTTAAEELVNHFINEKEGMYKGDLCRGVALYETGGLYFDVDIGVRMNLWNVIQTSTEFVTIRVHKQSNNVGAFFQAFIGVSTHHIVIQRYITLFYMYYSRTISQYDKIKGRPLGVVLLKRAYEEIQHEQKSRREAQISAARSLQQSTGNQLLAKYQYGGSLLNETSELWQEVLYIPELHQSILSHVPYPTWGTRRACKFIVVSSIQSQDTNEGSTSKSTKYAVVPFYSRIADSRMCPSRPENDVELQEKVNDHHHRKHHH
jgi:Glycosyltransferase sugar-binding region containing DXD motif